MGPASSVVDDKATTWRIGEVAKLTGVTTRTLRYWEELGLLTPKTHRGAGERLYSDAEIHRAKRIKELQELLGFSLAEVGVVLETEDVFERLRDAYHADPKPAHRLEVIHRLIEANDRLLARLDDKLARIQDFRDERAAKAQRLQKVAAELREGSAMRKKERP
ncbi:MAG TPA: MerR family transcriptional regulator [Acidimicrobiales bacterium]|jgi:DNA-binding transcriptional MerR regulator|nr:MerR family transcriptional regulator [Acidimicrobiales bacterium]